MENVFIKRKMENDPFYMASVEIIIPFHDETTRVANLIESIFQTIHKNRYLITLVDDASRNKLFIKRIQQAKIPGVRCLRLEEQVGFGGAINHALKNPFKIKSPIHWILIMHSDVVVEDNHWLTNLGRTLNRLKSSGVKMVSPLTNNPMVDSSLLVGEKSVEKPDQILVDGYLPMYCALAHRELFKRVGDFLPCPYAGVEVEDYAQRMKRHGYKQAICGNSWVNHYGGATLSNFKDNKKVQQILRNVREEFDQKNSKLSK